MEKGKIFIQIASYRDPQLVTTIKDCIKNAKHPENLVFCIAWQHSPDENIDEIKDLPNVKVIDIDHEKSEGACWARNLIQQKYDNEEYTLQLDSHHRFVENWDEQIIEMYHQCIQMGHPKPLLTGYIPSFDPDNDPKGRVLVPWRMDFDRFIPEGAVFFLPAVIPDWKERTSPVPSRFYSAHFAFTTGKFVLEVPHDPDYYFHGEEISIAVRAFTHGYDLFHPHRVVAWHEYTRKGRAKHWDDKSDWWKRNADCHSRNRCLFSMDGETYDSVDWGKYGFGKVRTLRDYEKYAGLHFGNRAVQLQTRKRENPPNKWWDYSTEEEWESSFLIPFEYVIDFNAEKIINADCDFLAVIFETKDGSVLYRNDMVGDILREKLSDMVRSGSKTIKIKSEFQTPNKPDRWVVWPHNKSTGWLDKTTENII
jgi:hypothetical protein